MELYKVVDTYDKLGYHRTGSDSEPATERFLCKHIEQAGGVVSVTEYPYLHYSAESSVRLNDRELLSMPLYYESIDTVHRSSNISIASVDTAQQEITVISKIDEFIEHAKRNCHDAVVIATRCETESLHAINVTPKLKYNPPVILVPGKEHGLISDHNIEVDFEGSINECTGRNIVARFGDHSLEHSLVITTPISGWFHCAGERGTGIALAIELAAYLGLTRPVTLVLTSGHELGYLGGFEFTDSIGPEPKGVFHIGSCVGARNSELFAYTNFAAKPHCIVESLVSRICTDAYSVCNPLQTTNWVGESECWARFGCPMLSIAGTNPQFHTPEDRLPDATTPGTLDSTFAVLVALGEMMSAISMP